MPETLSRRSSTSLLSVASTSALAEGDFFVEIVNFVNFARFSAGPERR
ncbi:MAG TPA: hypothetical protein VGB04_10490 [Allosphingosinicella sp.]|jgi:hypothetical protein